MKVQPNAWVVVDYTLKDDSGGVLDASEESGVPLAYVHGYGMIVPGLEKALAGLSAGDEKTIVVPAEEGYGEHDEELVIEVDRSEMPRPKTVAVGDELELESPDGEQGIMRVVEVTDDAVVLDGNHPLAGQTLHYSLKIRSVRPASEEEIARAAEGFEQAQGEEPPENLVQLRKPTKK